VQEGSRIRNNETLLQHLEGLTDPDESVLAFGLGAIGPRTVLVAATDRRLLLERVGIGFRRKDLDSIMYGSLEAVEGRKGDSATPRWARMNIQSAVTERISTSLLFKRPGDSVTHINFRPMPMFRGNGGKGPEIADAIASHGPGVVTEIDLRSERKNETGCLARGFRGGVVTGVVFGAVSGIASGSVAGLAGGFGAGFITGAIVAPMLPGMKRQFTGRG